MHLNDYNHVGFKVNAGSGVDYWYIGMWMRKSDLGSQSIDFIYIMRMMKGVFGEYKLQEKRIIHARIRLLDSQ